MTSRAPILDAAHTRSGVEQRRRAIDPALVLIEQFCCFSPEFKPGVYVGDGRLDTPRFAIDMLAAARRLEV